MELRRAVAFGVMSVCLHALWLLERRHAPAALVHEAQHISLWILANPNADVALTGPSGSADLSEGAALATAARERATARKRAPARGQAAHAAAPPGVSLTTASGGQEPPQSGLPNSRLSMGPSGAAAIAAAISPARAASALTAQHAPPVSGLSDRPPNEALARELHGALSRAAGERPELAQRQPPELRRTARGELTWRGAAFTATVANDGTVSFRDRPGFEYAGTATWRDSVLSPQIESALPPGKPRQYSGGGLLFRFDLMDTLERAVGNDPYAAERRWFLEQTAELRERMQRRHDLCSLSGRHMLLDHLDGLLGDRALSVAEIHRALLDLFDLCSAGREYRAGAQTVLGFVRARLPFDSPTGFDAEEIARFNRARSRELNFEPYKQ